MRTVCGAVLGLSLLAAAGCGTAPVEVSGAVTYDGQPIDSGGVITFVPTGDAKAAKAGDYFAAGRYSLPAAKALKPGPYKVEINWFKPTGKKVMCDDGVERDQTDEALPEKYHARTELTAELKPGPNQFDFHLKK